MKFALPFATLALVASSPAVAAEQRFMVTDFDRIQVEGPYQVDLSTGRTSAVVASGSRAALDRVSIDVQGRTLRIRPNRSAWSGYPDERAGLVRIVAATRELRAGIVIGPGNLSIDRAKGLRIDLAVSGSGRLGVAAIEADQLFVKLTGSGRIRLGGSAKQLRAAIQGSGDLDGVSFRADNADLTTETSGAVAFTAVRTARVRANGGGEVTIAGTAACTVTGLASEGVRCGPN